MFIAGGNNDAGNKAELVDLTSGPDCPSVLNMPDSLVGAGGGFRY